MSTAENLNIDNPRLWRLALELDNDAIGVVATSTVEDGALCQFAIPLNTATESRLKAIEEAVYSTPVILGDFDKVDVVIRTYDFLTIPSDLVPEAAAEVAKMLKIATDDSRIYIDTLSGSTNIVWAIPEEIAAFFARTFRNPTMQCHISPLIRYFNIKTALGNHSKIYGHLWRNSVDIIAFDETGNLRLATTKTVATPQDAAFFLLSTAEQCKFHQDTDEIILCGDASMRESIMPLLRRYFNYVLPMIFPSAAFKAGRDALNAPFPLVIQLICE